MTPWEAMTRMSLVVPQRSEPVLEQCHGKRNTFASL